MQTLIIGATRNWCKTILEWNLAADAHQNPHTEGGCSECLGALTIEGDKVSKNVAAYIIAHASKFVRPNSKRIASNLLGDLPNVSFKTPDNKIVLIVQNNNPKTQNFKIGYKNQLLDVNLDGRSIGTFVF